MQNIANRDFGQRDCYRKLRNSHGKFKGGGGGDEKSVGTLNRVNLCYLGSLPLASIIISLRIGQQRPAGGNRLAACVSARIRPSGTSISCS